MSDEHPELENAESSDRPLRSRGFYLAMRVVVGLGLVSLVVPGVLVSISVATETANRSCEILVARSPQEATASARFDLAGPVGPAWYCYANLVTGPEILIDSLGLIPGPPPAPRVQQSA